VSAAWSARASPRRSRLASSGGSTHPTAAASSRIDPSGSGTESGSPRPDVNRDRGAFARDTQQRGLTDPRLSADNRHTTATALDGLDDCIEGRKLFLALEQHLHPPIVTVDPAI
jgi:hypothetical protein